MGKPQSQSGLINVISYDTNGNISFVSGSTTLMSVSSSKDITTTGKITATTLVVQTITSSVDFVTGSTRFGSLATNTRQFTGSMLMTGSFRFGASNQQTAGTERIYVGQNSAVGVDDANSLSLFVAHAAATGSPQIGFTYQFRQNDNSGANLYGDAIRVIKNAGANSTYTVFTTNSTIGAGTERMKIDSNGTVTLSKDSVLGINTNDGSDNGYFALCGASGDGDNRGGHIYLSGNERGADPGTVVLAAGNVAGGAIVFRTGATVERMRISNTGATTFTSTVSASTSISVTNSGAQEAAFRATSTYADGYRAIIYLKNTHTGGVEYFIASTNNSDGVYGGAKLAISGNGGTNGVYLNGVLATSWSGQSDIRLKDIDSEIENAIDKVNKLRGVRFTWKSDETKKMQVGLIAQEVKEVLPEAVDFEEGNDDYRMGVQYTEVIPLLVNAIKELKAEIDELKNNK